MFEGIDRGDAIGESGLMMGGAGSFEIDRHFGDGSEPPSTVVLASASGYNEAHYSRTLSREEMNADPYGRPDPIRCDIALYATRTGGAVFSASAIGWSGGLAVNGYDNAVSTITGNVLERFLDRTPLAAPRPAGP